MKLQSLLVFGLFFIAENLANDPDSSDGWRCGIFFAGPPGASPRAKIFVLPKKFPTSCSAPKEDVYRSACAELMEKGLSEWNFDAPSRVRPQSGKTIGDDLCGPIPKDVRSPGLELGFYYSFCNNPWTDTGLRKRERVCCSQKKYVPC